MFKKYQRPHTSIQRARMRIARLFSCIFIVMSAVMPTTSSSANTDNELPSGCKPLTISAESAILPVKQAPVLVVIHNLTKTDLWLTHPIKDPGASAGWNSRLEANRWSAFLLDPTSLNGDSFEFQCIESRPGHEQQIACSDAISLCHLSAKMPEQKEAGSFWAGENLSFKELMAHLGRRGFELPENSL